MDLAVRIEDISEGSMDEMDHEHKQFERPSVSIQMQIQAEESARVKVDNKGSWPGLKALLVLPNLRIDTSIFANPRSSHLTVLMLELQNEDIAKASRVLQTVSDKVMRTLGNQPIYIRLRGLECMQDSVDNARVVYAPVLEVGEQGRLQQVCNVIIDEFAELGLAPKSNERRELKLHVTIMNERFRKSYNRYNSFDARKIFKKHGEYEWGEYLIPEIHLSQRLNFDERGYYHCCSSIRLPGNMQAE